MHASKACRMSARGNLKLWVAYFGILQEWRQNFRLQHFRQAGARGTRHPHSSSRCCCCAMAASNAAARDAPGSWDPHSLALHPWCQINPNPSKHHTSQKGAGAQGKPTSGSCRSGAKTSGFSTSDRLGPGARDILTSSCRCCCRAMAASNAAARDAPGSWDPPLAPAPAAAGAWPDMPLQTQGQHRGDCFNEEACE
jgi:hypothetical protein